MNFNKGNFLVTQAPGRITEHWIYPVKLEQLECLRFEDNPPPPHPQSYKFKKIAKISNFETGIIRDTPS